VTAPVATRRGIWIVRAVAFRPLDFAARTGYAARVTGLLSRMLYRDARMAARDSLERAFGYRLHPETCLPVARAVRAYLDSVSASARPRRARRSVVVAAARLAAERGGGRPADRRAERGDDQRDRFHARAGRGRRARLAASPGENRRWETSVTR